ncbi:MAG TPA: DUF5777 family beta-barrel protein [Bacteroidales bacterium]|nr:DUF5777 family beta-barrel protein [Bacteroidales bacterium]
MKKFSIILILSLLLLPAIAQEETTEQVSRPVRFTFATSRLVDNQTVATPYKGGLEFVISHRFSNIENYHNLFGIYGSANTRLGLDYGVTDRLMIGVGTTQQYKLQDINWKYLILRQTDDNSMPLSLSYYGNVVADLQKDEAFGPAASYRHIHRFSYFTQLIAARKINDIFSVQVAPSAIYYNSVPIYSDTTGYKNFNLGLSVGGRANIAGSHSIILEYDQLLTKQDLDIQPKPNLSLGWELNTATHTFQLFVANFNSIVAQRNLLFNTNDFANGDFLIGFNITVRM